MDGNRVNVKTESLCGMTRASPNSPLRKEKEALRAQITESLETDDSVDRLAKVLDKAVTDLSDVNHCHTARPRVVVSGCRDAGNESTTIEDSISNLQYEYEPTGNYGYSPSRSDRSGGSEKSVPSVDGSLKELFSSVNSLLTSRQTFTLLEGTTLETELDRLKQMGRRRSMTNAPTFSPVQSPLPHGFRRRNSVDNCIVGSSYYHPTPQSSLPSSSMRSSSIQEDSSTEQSEIEYVEQKKMIHGLFKDSNISVPIALDGFVPQSPKRRQLSDGFLPNQDSDDSLSSSVLLTISPLTDYSGSSATSLGANSVSCSTAISSLSCSLDDPRKPPSARDKVMTGINMQRAFGTDELMLGSKREAYPIRNDKAPRKPGRRRSIDM